MLEHDNRPWGSWQEYLNEPGYRVKRLVVLPGKRLSLQSHALRSEVWVVVAGTGEVTIGGEVHLCCPGTVFEVPVNVKHRIASAPDDVLVIVETQLGVCREDDIVRYEDDYGRAE